MFVANLIQKVIMANFSQISITKTEARESYNNSYPDLL